jgi:hypothetical protein
VFLNNSLAARNHFNIFIHQGNKGEMQATRNNAASETPSMLAGIFISTSKNIYEKSSFGISFTLTILSNGAIK